MLSKLSYRVLTGVITIPIAISLTGCGGTDVKKSEPVKPAVSTSQTADSDPKDTSKAGDTSKTGNAGNAGVDGGKSSNSSKSQSVKGNPNTGKGNAKSVPQHKPVKQQTSKTGKTSKSAKTSSTSSKPKPKTGKTSTGKTNNGYKLQPGEREFDKNSIDKNGNITGGGDSEGNVWDNW